MMSGGTRPSTRSITKKGAPSGTGSASDQRTRGTGTTSSAPISRITRNCRSMSYSGKTGTAPGSGATRATSRSLRRAPASLHARSKSSVSLDMPLVEGPSTAETSGAAAAPRRRASQRSRRSRSSPRSRVEVRGRAIAPPSPPAGPAPPSPTAPRSAGRGREEARGRDRVDVLADLRDAAVAELDDEAVPVLVLGAARARADPRLRHQHVALADGDADLGALRAGLEDPGDGAEHQVDHGVGAAVRAGERLRRRGRHDPDEVVRDEPAHRGSVAPGERVEVGGEGARWRRPRAPSRPRGGARAPRGAPPARHSDGTPGARRAAPRAGRPAPREPGGS